MFWLPQSLHSSLVEKAVSVGRRASQPREPLLSETLHLPITTDSYTPWRDDTHSVQGCLDSLTQGQRATYVNNYNNSMSIVVLFDSIMPTLKKTCDLNRGFAIQFMT